MNKQNGDTGSQAQRYVIGEEEAAKLRKQIKQSTITLTSIDILKDEKGSRLRFAFQVKSPIVVKQKDGTDTLHEDISVVSQTVPVENLPVHSYDQALTVANAALSQQLERWAKILVSPASI